MIDNTAPLVLNGKKLTRRFLGNLFPKTCIEKNELKAYLKGYNRYAYGRDENGNQIFYNVRQQYFYI